MPAGLDWKRAFGLHFWFAAPFEAGLAEGLRRYEDALQTQHAPASPLPWYLERPSLAKDSTRWQTPRGTQDALFLLLNLQADTATPLESALNPSTFGPTPLDYRLPWHLYTVLALAMRTRDFADRQLAEHGEELGSSASANALTANYAWGLEQMGLWDQAAFVLLHLDVPEA
jgi:nuclear pore complex protein Nup98-Nup96